VPPHLLYQLQGQWVTFVLNGDEVNVGRDAQNDLVIEHRSVSRKHARLYREGRSWRVEDLGSRYGTSVNDLGHSDAVLGNGDKIFLHKFPLTYVDEAQEGKRFMDWSEPGTDLGQNTVFQNTVDFSTLAAIPPDINRLQKLLAVVTRASECILVSKSLDETFRNILDLIFEQMPVQRGFIMLWDDERRDLVQHCAKHKTGAVVSSGPMQFSRTIADKVLDGKVAVLTTDAQTDGRFADGESIMDLGIRSAIAAPLWNGDNVDGLIYGDTTLLAKAFDSFDLDLLSALGNHLAVAIEQARLQRSVVEQQLARKRLARYHSPAVIERITSGAESADALVADERDVTVLFADVVNFTRRCEKLEPREVAELLNRYFSRMTEVIFRHEGTLDKFIGDCLMAVFGAPFSTEDHAVRAVDAALEMRQALDALNAPLADEERMEFRVGLHSGRVVAGDIGSLQRSDYTVLGSTVNLASRLESGVAKPGQIVISEATRDGLGEGYVTRFVGEFRPKGVSREVRCYEVLRSQS